MEPLLIFLLLFLAITAVTGAALAVVRDLYAARQPALARLPKNGSLAPIPRLVIPPDSRQGGFGQRVNNWLDRVHLESGWSIDGESASWLELAAGVLVGGVVFLLTENLLFTALAATLGMAAVLAVFLVARSRRRKKIREQLPDTIEYIARAVRAGESVDEALVLAGDTIANPLGVEFRRCARQMSLGLSIDAAMRSMTSRVSLPELHIFASTLIVQRQAGGNLPGTLERLAKVIRDRLSYYRQFRAATAGSRLSTLMIAAAGPLIVTYMMIWQPDYFGAFFQSATGQVMLVVAAVMYLAGLFIISRMLHQDY